MEFKDYFSVQAADYVRYRPDYPKELFDFILAHTKGRQLAWDCATGNGQVAGVLANHFEKVIATDASKSQIDAAVPYNNVTYKVAPAENSGLESNSVDLVTVGQALHWFDFDLFYKEVKRVAKPGALLVAISYGNPTISEDLDKVIEYYYNTIVGPYWPGERKYIDEEYRTIPFPFQKLEAPDMHMTKQWDLAAFTGYLNTWSGTQQYIKAHGRNPLQDLETDFIKAWGDPAEVRTVSWPLYILAAHVLM